MSTESCEASFSLFFTLFLSLCFPYVYQFPLPLRRLSASDVFPFFFCARKVKFSSEGDCSNAALAKQILKCILFIPNDRRISFFFNFIIQQGLLAKDVGVPLKPNIIII